MKKEVQDIFQGAIETLRQKMFWQIQGLNLFLIVKKVVYFVMCTLSLIYIVSSISQGLHLSNFQKGNMLTGILLFVLIMVFFKAFKNIFRGSDGIVEFSKAIINSLLGSFVICLSFSINITNFETLSDLLLRWFVVSSLLVINNFLVFKKLSKDIKNGKKSDWVGKINRQVTNKYEYSNLVFTEVLETYQLKYSRAVINLKTNHNYLVFTSVGEKLIETTKERDND